VVALYRVVDDAEISLLDPREGAANRPEAPFRAQVPHVLGHAQGDVLWDLWRDLGPPAVRLAACAPGATGARASPTSADGARTLGLQERQLHILNMAMKASRSRALPGDGERVATERSAPAPVVYPRSVEEPDSRVVFACSVALGDRAVSEEEGVPAGEEVAVVVHEGLRTAGMNLTELDQSSWGFFLYVDTPAGSFCVDVASNAGWAPAWPPWSVLLEEPGRFASELRRAEFVRVRCALHEGLSNDPRLSAIGWLSASEWRPRSSAVPRALPRG